MKEALRLQRQLCYDALGNVPKNLKKSYHKKIMNASEPEYKKPLGLSLVVIGFALGVAFISLVSWLVG